MDFHPVLTHFPIVLSLLLCAAENILAPYFLVLDKNSSQVKLSTYFLVFRSLCFLFIIFSVGSFFSGLQAQDIAEQASKIPEDIIALHYQWGRWIFFGGSLVAAAGFAIDKIYEDALMQKSYRIVLVLLCMATLYTGFLGGTLVFKHGAGVHRAQDSINPVGNSNTTSINADTK
jgi:uncharacterized membrane protein